MPDEASVAHFFVDEAGDLTLFDRRGRVIIGTEGVSHTFMVGIAEVAEPVAVTQALEQLRRTLLADSYFAGVPSMQPAAKKTALAFHANDDVPEVRREVFRLLQRIEVQVFVGLRRKHALARDHRAAYLRTGRKRGPESVYDYLVTRIFKDRLHKASENRIVFARRGKADRNTALDEAIRLAKIEFEARWRKGIDRPTTITSSTPSETTCLQIADYHLWALQRLVERSEDRYFSLLAPNYRLILDCDDNRRNGYGEYYMSRNPLTLEKLMPVL